MIESYNFGKIIINSKEYNSDIIIYKKVSMINGGEEKATIFALKI